MAENKQEVQSCPSYNPADLTTTAGMLDYIYRCNSMTTENCMPAIVESYDRKKNVVTVKPGINITAATGETIERESITATVLSMCGAKFIINFPLEKGDTGWLITADRDISLFRERRKVINANTNRIHSIEDSFFIPDRVNDFKLEAEDEKNLVIQNLDRNIRISVAQDKIKITTKTKPKENGKGDGNASQNGVSSNNASSTDGTSEASNSEEQSNTTTVSLTEGEVAVETTGKVTVKAKKNVSCTVEEGDIECKCENLTAEVKNTAQVKAQTINIEGNVNIKGNVNIEGDENVSGNVTASDCIGGGKSLAGHIHQGVHGPTGGPQ